MWRFTCRNQTTESHTFEDVAFMMSYHRGGHNEMLKEIGYMFPLPDCKEPHVLVFDKTPCDPGFGRKCTLPTDRQFVAPTPHQAMVAKLLDCTFAKV